MNRIEERMELLKKEGKKAFVTYITAGLPDMEGCKKLLKEQFRAGVDTVQLGVPFSDPVADGPVIQEASQKAIERGCNLKKILQMVKELREEGCEVPIMFMMYYNTALHFGLENLAKECKVSGIDGIMVPDLPFEEQEDLNEALKKESADTCIMQLVAPVSKDRIPMVLKEARGFVYCISQLGVTGQSTGFHKDTKEYLENVRNSTDIPVLMGFGIKEPADVKDIISEIDGVIVGTKLIQTLEENNYNEEAAYRFVKEFKDGIN